MRIEKKRKTLHFEFEKRVKAASIYDKNFIKELYPQCYYEEQKIDDCLITCAEDVCEILKFMDISNDEAMEITLNVNKGDHSVFSMRGKRCVLFTICYILKSSI